MTGRSWRGPKLRHVASVCAGIGVVTASSCYSTGNGTPPPINQIYYPVGLAVSPGGNVLYVANSDFDLQYNGGTVQSYDLRLIRRDVVRLMLGLYPGAPPFDAGPPVSPSASDSGAADSGSVDDAGSTDAGLSADSGTDAGVPSDGGLPPGFPADAGALPFTAPSTAACPFTQLYPAPTNPNDPGGWNNMPGRLPIGQACAPPMDSTGYFRNGLTIGAFATDAQLSKKGERLFVPVRGDATLTWMNIVNDDGLRAPAWNDTSSTYAPFYLNCGARTSANGCGFPYHAGQLTDPGNTRQVAMPGEPFAMAFTEDGTAIAVTNQAESDTSLFLSGLQPGVPPFPASIQFYVDNLPLGGDGIVAIPHDLAALPNMDPTNPLRPAFLQTSNSSAEIDLLRYYTDEGWQGLYPVDGGGANLADAGLAIQVGSSNLRPFLIKERQYSVNVEVNGANSRGIAIDPTPRIACEQAALAGGAAITSAQYIACAQTPSRVFIASRSPASLIVGQIGAMSEEGGTYDPDALTLFQNIPLSLGPSNVYVAPIVDRSGRYAVRVFVVCFDSQTIAIYDPDTGLMENVVLTGPGPFAMAFDPFDPVAVATHAQVPFDSRSPYTTISRGNASDGQPALRNYRFAYITSFTDSYIQIMDLDQSFQDDRLQGVSTFETMVYSLGLPIQPVQAN